MCEVTIGLAVGAGWIVADQLLWAAKAWRNVLGRLVGQEGRQLPAIAGIVPLADITSDPDHQAFTAGVEAGVIVIAVAIGSVAVFGLFRWALARMSNGE